MKYGLSLFCLALLTCQLRAELIIKRDHDGTLTFSNSIDAIQSPRGTFRPNGKSRGSRPRVQSNSVFSEFYRNRIRHHARKNGLREDLALAVAKRESSYNPYAVSHKGAVGIMQLMHDTANQYGVFDRFNAEQNIEAGVKHLKVLWDLYKGNIQNILAAYNAGSEAVKKYNGVPPYKETREYVKHIMSELGLPCSIPMVSTPGPTPSPAKRIPIYRIVLPDGRITITDSMPLNPTGQVERIY